MRRDRVKVLVLALMIVAAGVLPLLSMTQFLQTAAGILLGYAIYRTGMFLYDALEMWVEFRRFESRIDAIARQWRARRRMRLVR